MKLRRIDGLDGLRVASAVGVVVYHVLGAVLGPNPPVAVILPPVAFTFFVISGFVIYRPFVAAHAGGRPAPALGRFYGSRLFRVLPLWWTVLAVYLLVDGTDGLHGTAQWVTTVLLLQFTVAEARFSVIGPAWALSVEWLFYLAVPLFAMGVAALHRAAGRSIGAARFHYAVLVPLMVLCVLEPSARPFLAILAGMVFAVADVEALRSGHRPDWLRFSASPATALVVTVVAWVILVDYPYRAGTSVQWVEQDLLVVAIWLAVAVAWFATVAFGRGDGVITRWLGTPFMVRASMLTFGLYLWHDLVLKQVLKHLGTDVHLGAALYLTALGAMALTVASYLLVERPMIGLRARMVPDPDLSTATAARRRSTRPASRPAPSTSAAVVTHHDRLEPAPPTARRSPKQWITTVDGLRIVASFAIVVFHVCAERRVSPTIARAVTSFAVPVFSVFFMVSGFVMYRTWTQAHARQAVGDGRRVPRDLDGGILTAWFRRFLRIFPAYWIVQGFSLATEGTGDLRGVGDWIQLALLSPVPRLEVLIHHGLGVIVWTLVLELSFYLVLPFFGRGVAWAIDHGVGYGAAQAVPIGVCFVAFVAISIQGPIFMVVMAALCLGMGFAAIDSWQRTVRRWVPGLKTVATTPSLVPLVIGTCWAIGYAVSRHEDPELLFRTYLPVHALSMLVMPTILFVPAVFGRPGTTFHRLLSNRWTRFLGPLTFGVYLWHYPVIRATTDRIDLPVLALAAWAIVAATALAFVTNRLVERPIDRVRGRLKASPRPRTRTNEGSRP